MTALTLGKHRARRAESVEDFEAIQALRRTLFRDGDADDRDQFDAFCLHFLVEDISQGDVVAAFRLMPLPHGAEIHRSYSAQHYELSSLLEYDSPMVEVGRFCVASEDPDPDILRVAWGALTQFVDENHIAMLFGCSSFEGTEAERYEDAFAVLLDRHLAPKRWLPRVKSPNVFRFADRLLGRADRKPDRKKAMRLMPPLLKTYLAMGAWVSDHAVVDRDLGTLHVFIGLEVASIPAGRKRLLRVIAG